MLKGALAKISGKIRGFKVPHAENFTKYLEGRFGDGLSILGPNVVTDEEVLSKLKTKYKVMGWEIFLNGEHLGYYLTIGENKENDFGRIYDGRLGYKNQALNTDKFTLIYWDEMSKFMGGKNSKLKDYMRIDGHSGIPFP